MKPIKFNESKLVVAADWMHDGHAAIKRRYGYGLPGFKRYADLSPGRYFGNLKECQTDDAPFPYDDLAHDNLSLDMLDIDIAIETILPPSKGKVNGIRLRTSNYPIYVADHYYPLLTLGTCRSAGKGKAIVVYDGSEPIAFVMPMKLTHPLDVYEYGTDAKQLDETIARLVRMKINLS